jgi:tetratricopeptide (TPR) repeat protein
MDTTMSTSERYERGRTLRQAKMYDQAMAELQHATHDPNYAGQARTQLGLCLRAMGRHEEAVTTLRQALHSPSLSPQESIHVLYLVGQSLESLGRYAEAIEAYNWVRQEDAGFLDVGSRIKNLCGAPRSLLTQAVDLLQMGRSLIGKLAKC